MNQTLDNRNHEKKYEVCIVGVGFVGLTLAMALVQKGVKVRGVEKNIEVVDALNSGFTDVHEPGLEAILQDALSRGLFSIFPAGNVDADISKSNVFIITVGTPIRDRAVDMESLGHAIDEVLPYLKDDDLVIVRSTVMVTATRNLVLPRLSSTGLRVRLAMCPERTIEGNALKEIEFLPQIVGGLDVESAQAAEDFFSVICGEIVNVESLEAAELAKLVNNTFRDVMFGFSNEIASVANSYGVSAVKIIEAANRNYPRSNIALPGPSGGPCLEKDPWILIQSATQSGVELDISTSARLMNEKMIPDFLGKSLVKGKPIQRVGILGLAFKGNPPTRDTRGSAAFQVVDFFTGQLNEVEFIGYEPAGHVKGFEGSVLQKDSADSVISDCDYLIVLTNSQSFSRATENIATLGKPDLVVVDFWNKVSKENIGEHQVLFSWGAFG